MLAGIGAWLALHWVPLLIVFGGLLYGVGWFMERHDKRREDEPESRRARFETPAGDLTLPVVEGYTAGGSIWPQGPGGPVIVAKVDLQPEQEE